MKKHDFQLRDTLPFRASTPLPFAFNGGGFIHEVLVELTGTLATTAAGTTGGTATGQYNPGALLAKFEVDAIAKNGVYPDGKLKNVFARSVLAREIFDEGGRENGAAITNAAGSQTVSQFYLLRFAIPDAQIPAETALNVDAYSSIILTITTGSIADLFSGNDRTYDYSGLTIRIYDRREAGSPGYKDVAVLYESDVPVNIAAANSDFTVKTELQVAESFYDVLVISETGAARTLADTIINQVIVNSNNEQFQKFYGTALKRITRMNVKDKAQDTTGLYMVDIAKDGLLRGSLRPVDFKLNVANPGGANLDRLILNSRRVVLPEEYLPSTK